MYIKVVIAVRFFIRGSTKVAQYVQSCKAYLWRDNDTKGRFFFEFNGPEIFIHLFLIIAYNIQLVQSFYIFTIDKTSRKLKICVD